MEPVSLIECELNSDIKGSLVFNIDMFHFSSIITCLLTFPMFKEYPSKWYPLTHVTANLYLVKFDNRKCQYDTNFRISGLKFLLNSKIRYAYI